MLLRINPLDERPIYVQILDEVRRAVMAGELQADDPLPSIRQLATELRVNPNTVQGAFRELEREGLIYVRKGHGAYISARSVGAAYQQQVARGVADRAAADAKRHGVPLAELIAILKHRAHPRADDAARRSAREAK